MTCLTLLRHGQSEWNVKNQFTGWVDVDLTEKGENQAKKAGKLLKEHGIVFDQAYTSYLKRAIKTLWLVLTEMDLCYLPVEKNWRLNERHYGGLTGLNKKDVMKKHGMEQVKIWRRSYDIPPPKLDRNNPLHPRFDKRYHHINDQDLPSSESLKMTSERVIPYYQEEIAPKIRQNKSVIITAHGNTIRALTMYLLELSAEEILSLEIPTGNPLILKQKGTEKFKSACFLDHQRCEPFPFVNENA